MSTTPAVGPIAAAPPPASRHDDYVALLLWFAGLLALSYAFVFAGLSVQWLHNEDMSHGPFVPVFVGYVVWRQRHRLALMPLRPNSWGLVPLIVAGVTLCIGPPGLPIFAFLTRMSLLMSVVGLVVYLCGFAFCRALLYPLLVLVLMIPLPGFIYTHLTLPLQFLASTLAERLLESLGWSVLRDGNIIFLAGQTLSVAEACSGMRSLMSLTFLGQVYIYLFDDRAWMRGVIALLAVPIAIFANALRIVFTAYAGAYNPAWTAGTLHEIAGWAVFVVAFVALVCTHYGINLVSRHVVKI